MIKEVQAKEEAGEEGKDSKVKEEEEEEEDVGMGKGWLRR